MTGKATRTRIACGDEQYICRKAGAFVAALDTHFAFFERLAQAFEGGALKLGKFVKEEDATVSTREFTRTQWTAAAEQRLRRNTVMRRSKRSLMRKALNRAMQGFERSQLEREILRWNGK